MDEREKGVEREETKRGEVEGCKEDVRGHTGRGKREES